jgi:hypothetical protein
MRRRLLYVVGTPAQEPETLREWSRRLAGGYDLGDDRQAAHEGRTSVRLGEAPFAIAGVQRGAWYVPAGIEDTTPVRAAQLSGDLGTEPPISESEIDDSKIRLELSTKRDRVVHGPSDTAHVISITEEGFCDQVGDRQFIFGNKYRERAPITRPRLAPKSRRLLNAVSGVID